MLHKTIRIAIAGKRQHKNLSFLTNNDNNQLDIILNSLKYKLHQNSDLCIQFLTGLADGSDLLVAKRIIESGITHHLSGIIPFSVEHFKNHPLYPIQDTQTFDEIWNECSSKICINDEETSARICDPEYTQIQEAANKGYEAQAMLMLRRCDFLLAIADPRDEEIQAGTLHTVKRALAYQIPVIFISLENNHTYCFDEETSAYEPIKLLIKKKDNEGVKNYAGLIFQRIINSQNPEQADDINYETIVLSGIDTKPKKWTLAAAREKIWPKISSRLKEQYEKSNPTSEDVDENNHDIEAMYKDRKISEPGEDKITNMQDRMDAANSFYANNYRGGFILNNRLAVCAVFIAILALVAVLFANKILPHCASAETHPIPVVNEDPTHAKESAAVRNHDTSMHTTPQPTHTIPGHSEINTGKYELPINIILLLLAGLKLSILIAIYRNSKSGHHENWNEKAINTRYVAERLRLFRHLVYNGITKSIKPSLGKHISNNIEKVPHEAVYRMIEGNISLQQTGLISLNAIDNLLKLRKYLVEDQISYHKKTSGRMRILEQYLEQRGKILNLVAMGLVAIDILILIFAFTPFIHEPFPEFMHHVITPIFIATTAIIPAVVAAYNSVRFQTEAKKLKERYALMSGLLAEKIQKIDIVLKHTDGMGSEILDYFPVIKEVEQIMIDEVSEWGLLYRKEFVES